MSTVDQMNILLNVHFSRNTFVSTFPISRLFAEFLNIRRKQCDEVPRYEVGCICIPNNQISRRGNDLELNKGVKKETIFTKETIRNCFNEIADLKFNIISQYRTNQNI